MKKSVMLSISLLIGCLNASLNCMDENGLTFLKAESDEDLRPHEQILRLFYLSKTNSDEKEYTKRLIDTNFPIIKRWVSQKEEGKHLFSLFDQRILIAFTTIEELDKERLALHYTAFSSGYEHLVARCLTWIKEKFSNAKTLSTTCSSKTKGLQEILERLGFVRDDEYKCNKEIATATGDSVGYTLDLENLTKMLAKIR